MESSNRARRRRPLEALSKGETSTASLSVSSSENHQPRSTTPTFPRRTASSFLRQVSLLLLPLVLSVVIILIFAEKERRNIEKAELSSTLHLYTKDSRVCATDDLKQFETYETIHQVPSSHMVAHCGACSNCSTIQDMTIYAGTTKTLTDGATWCSTRAYLASFFLWRGMDVYRNVAAKCLRETVGFTEACQECWVEDMACSIQACVFTCLKSVYLKREPKNDPVTGALNVCLSCDEKLCGPDFLKCSGSNRRRQGIESDIARGGAEICQSVTMDWTKVVEESDS